MCRVLENQADTLNQIDQCNTVKPKPFKPNLLMNRKIFEVRNCIFFFIFDIFKPKLFPLDFGLTVLLYLGFFEAGFTFFKKLFAETSYSDDIFY